MSTQNQNENKMDMAAFAKYAAIVLTAIILIYLAVRVNQLNGELRDANQEADKKVQQVRDEMTKSFKEAAKAAAIRASAAMSAFLDPLLYSHKEGDITIQNAVDALAATREFDLIIVADSTGKVVAASDRKYMTGTPEAMQVESQAVLPVGSGWQVTDPIMHGSSRMGTLRIVVK